MGKDLFRQSLYATAPLLLWAAHFTFCYLLVAAQCTPALIGPGMPAMWVLGVVSLAALGACAAMAWRATRTPVALLDWARGGSAILALAGIAWTSLPLLLLDGCG